MLAIVGVLLAVGMPAYQRYGVKVRIADMQRYALLLTQNQNAYYEDNGRFYGRDAAERATVAVDGDDDRGFYQYHNWTTSSKATTGAIIEIYITEDLYPDADRNDRFIYEGTADTFGNITWKCVQHKSASLRMDAAYVPDDCTDIFSAI